MTPTVKTTLNSRTHSWATPTTPPAELSGLEFLQALIDGTIPPPPIAATLGFTLVHVEPGVAIFEGETGEHQYNPLGSVHGGYYATLLDSALGCAVMSRLPAGRGYTTTQLGVHMVRPAFAHTGILRCEAKAVHVGRTVATAEARLVGANDGKLYAHGTTTCAIFSIAP
ncbi:PaaI family thioesterase [Planotetraspora sp. GP83]|uniref:PaaI family thioesterase n=1 Tax=Planotetraspora sp. GP83 TaxID=3156264 RepID=UPI0035126CEF